MNYVQSNDDNSKEIVGVIDVVFSDVSQIESSSTKERNSRRLVIRDDSPATTTSATTITPEAVSALFGYFECRNFYMNQTLPRKNSHGYQEIDTIILSFGLKRTQVTRQLRCWKESKFMIDGHVLTMSTEENTFYVIKTKARP